MDLHGGGFLSLCVFARVCYAPEGGLLLEVLVDKPTGKEQVALMIKL